MIKRTRLVLIPALLFSALVGCSGGDSQSGSSNTTGLSVIDGKGIPGIPTASADSGTTTALVGDTCHSDDPNRICLALKFVAYKDSSGNPVVSQDQAITVVKEMNALWNQCGVAFQLDNFLPVVPKDNGLRYNTANNSELDDIRKTFGDDQTLLIAITGSWDRSGTLGNTGANAWASMPGESLYGAILEKSVGTFSNIIAHEVGHYLGLPHADNKSLLMNPVIYKESTKITQGECSEVRSTISTYWQRMQR